MSALVDKLRAKLALPGESADADAVNSTFFSPFKGMTEMYALQKGIEHGQQSEHERTKATVEALLEAVEALDNWCHGANKDWPAVGAALARLETLVAAAGAKD